MVNPRIEINTESVAKILKDYPKGARYWIARALTKVAQTTRDKLQETVSDDLIIRNHYVRRSIQMNMATKKDLAAEVGSLLPFMALQAEGGDKRPKVGETVGSPSQYMRGGPAKLKKTPPNKWPSKLKAKNPKKYFELPQDKAAKIFPSLGNIPALKSVVFERGFALEKDGKRAGKPTKRKRRPKVYFDNGGTLKRVPASKQKGVTRFPFSRVNNKIAYALMTKVTIEKEKWKFFKTAQKIVDEHLEESVNYALKLALEDQQRKHARKKVKAKGKS